ncbi:hypothetical protein SLA2020_438260 [Shorea laevis]
MAASTETSTSRKKEHHSGVAVARSKRSIVKCGTSRQLFQVNFGPRYPRSHRLQPSKVEGIVPFDFRYE